MHTSMSNLLKDGNSRQSVTVDAGYWSGQAGNNDKSSVRQGTGSESELG